MPSKKDLRTRLVEALGSRQVQEILKQRVPPPQESQPLPLTGDLARLHKEVVHLVAEEIRHVERKAKPALWPLTYKLLWDASHEPDLDRAVDAFLATVRLPTAKFRVLVALRNIHPFDPEVSLEGVRIGLLESLVPVDVAKKVRIDLPAGEKVWALTEVEAPNHELAFGPALERIEIALDFVATLEYRGVDQAGYAGQMDVGLYWVAIAADGTMRAWFRREWLRETNYHLDPDLLVDKPAYDFKQGPIPWTKLPSDSETARRLRTAYRRFGRACRAARDGEAALPLALSALESLIVPERRGSKRARLVGRIMLSSHHVKRGFTDPMELYEWYLDRNEIIHEGLPFRWTQQDARQALWAIYRNLDILADFLISKGAASREDAVTKLHTSEAIQGAQEWIAARQAELKAEREAARVPAVRDEFNLAIGAWQEVLDELDSTARALAKTDPARMKSETSRAEKVRAT